GRVLPVLPDAGEGHHIAVGAVYEEGLLADALGLPLEEAVGRDNRPAPAEGVTEHAAGGDRFLAGVDRPRAVLARLRPTGGEAPVEADDHPLAVLLNHGRDDRRGRDVVVGGEIALHANQPRLEQAGEFFELADHREATTHWLTHPPWGSRRIRWCCCPDRRRRRSRGRCDPSAAYAPF